MTTNVNLIYTEHSAEIFVAPSSKLANMKMDVSGAIQDLIADIDRSTLGAMSAMGRPQDIAVTVVSDKFYETYKDETVQELAKRMGPIPVFFNAPSLPLHTDGVKNRAVAGLLLDEARRSPAKPSSPTPPTQPAPVNDLLRRMQERMDRMEEQIQQIPVLEDQVKVLQKQTDEIPVLKKQIYNLNKFTQQVPLAQYPTVFRKQIVKVSE